MANDSNSTPSNQLGFMSALSSDIVIEVFFYLDQFDCLTCMAVCRDWYHSIPQYAQHMWQHLHLDTRDLTRNQKRREKCLGNHVRSVTLRGQYREEDLFTLMKQLLGCGCTDIQSLELILWVIVNENTLVNLLRQLAPRLTRLRLTECHFNNAPMYFFDACPDLIQFACQGCDFLLNCSDSFLAEAPVDEVTKVTHLTLDACMNKKQVERILRMCPELRSFIGASKDPWLHRSDIIHPDVSLSVDPGLILSWCPKVNFLVTSFCYNRFDAFNDDPCIYVSTDVGLCYFNVTARYGLDQIAHHLSRNQQTLEFLCIHHNDDNLPSWPPMLESLVLPKLHTIALKDHYCAVASLIIRLNHCPAIETLDLASALSVDQPVTQPLNTMHRLRTLCWKRSVLVHNEFSLFLVIDRSPALETLDIVVSGELSIPTKLTGLKQLKYLSVCGYPHVNAYSPEKKADIANFFDYLAGNSKLERIRFANVSVLGYHALMAIAAIPTLKTLDIHLASDLQDEELREFIEKLGEKAIASLTLRNARRLPFAVLKASAELPLLTKFSTQATMYDERMTRVCKDGLQHLLYTSPRLTSVSFEHLIKIEENGNPFTYDQMVELVNRGRKTHDGKHWKFELESRSLDGMELFQVYYTKK